MSASGRNPGALLGERRKRDLAIQREAKAQGTTPENIRHQVAFSLFFGRFFAQDAGDWLVLGGNALLIRTGGGRFTTDIDLARSNAWETVEELRESIERALIAGDRPDDFDFHVGSCKPHSEPDRYGYGQKTAEIQIVVTFGGREFATFGLDVTTKRHVESGVDSRPLKPVLIDDPALQDLPEIPLVPVENHLADKIAAMYEYHGADGTTASTRYRDLADIIRIVEELEFNENRLVEVLRHEQARRQITLPRTCLTLTRALSHTLRSWLLSTQAPSLSSSRLMAPPTASIGFKHRSRESAFGQL